MKALPAVVFFVACAAGIATADDLSVAIDKDGGVIVAGKKLDAAEYSAALEVAAGKCRAGGISSLKLAIACEPETSWEPFQRCLNRAAAAGIWDIRLSVGDKTVAIPLPRDNDDEPAIFFPEPADEDEPGEKKETGDGKDAKPIVVETRIFVWTGESGDFAKDARPDAPKGGAKTWARLNAGASADVSSDPGPVVDQAVKALEKAREAAKKDRPAIFDIASAVAMKRVLAFVAALQEKGVKKIEFAAPMPK